MFKWFKRKKKSEFINGWDKLPIGKFMEISKVNQSKDDEDTKALKCAAILSNRTLQELEQLPIADAMELVSRTSFLYTEIEEVKLKKNYNLGGRKYVPLRKMEDMVAAQFIDFQSIAHNINEMLPEFLAIFFVPEGHKYGDRKYEMADVISDIKEYLMVEEALSLSNFFVNVYRRYVKRTLLYSEAEMKVMSWLGPKKTREIASQTEKMLKETRERIDFMFGCRSLKQ